MSRDAIRPVAWSCLHTADEIEHALRQRREDSEPLAQYGRHVRLMLLGACEHVGVEPPGDLLALARRCSTRDEPESLRRLSARLRDYAEELSPRACQDYRQTLGRDDAEGRAA